MSKKKIELTDDVILIVAKSEDDLLFAMYDRDTGHYTQAKIPKVKVKDVLGSINQLFDNEV